MTALKGRPARTCHSVSSIRAAAICGTLALCAVPLEALAAANCKYRPQRPPVIKNMGPCNFDLATQSYAGEPLQQAMCLLTPVLKGGKLGPPREALPSDLADRVGRSTGLPDREALRTLLNERGFAHLIGNGLDQPVAMGHDGDPLSRGATYFVIHDTSGPNYLHRPFPPTINDEGGPNRLANHACANKIERAHIFINRPGAIMLAHDFSVPWRGTKFEMWREFGPALKGLFIHNELIQPRRSAKGYGRRNDFEAPDPGFTPAQYDALALVYVVASTRAGFWMIPAYHAVIDEGIYDKHDDPQNFELEAFARSIGKWMQQLPVQKPPKVERVREEATPPPASPVEAAPSAAAPPASETAPSPSAPADAPSAASASPDSARPPEP